MKKKTPIKKKAAKKAPRRPGKAPKKKAAPIRFLPPASQLHCRTIPELKKLLRPMEVSGQNQIVLDNMFYKFPPNGFGFRLDYVKGKKKGERDRLLYVSYEPNTKKKK